MKRVVIIGAGECGVRAAFGLRENGFDGDIILIGDENVLPYERPPLSKDAVALRPIRPQSDYDAAEIENRTALKVQAIHRVDQTITLCDDRTIAYDKLLLATGARARELPGLKGCLTLRTHNDAQRIWAALQPGARISIIGGGFIGLELAATAKKRGADICVIEAGARVLERAVPKEIADILLNRHRAEGVLIDCGITVEKADLHRIVLTGGTEISFDTVIAGVGSIPNTELAIDAGLKVQNGILVNAQFQTSDPNIFAAGDCCNFIWRGKSVRLESWKAAQDQGAHVAKAIMGSCDAYNKVPWFWSDQYDLSIQIAGLFDARRTTQVREASEDRTILYQCDTDGTLQAAAGLGYGNTIAKDIRILEKLMEKGDRIKPELLADPEHNLKKLLRAA